jgi:alkylresorcinol/alkylpyrone synthase
LRQFGNLSSPSVMIALEKHLAGGQPSDRIWLTAFGAGFSCHSAQLVRV